MVSTLAMAMLLSTQSTAFLAPDQQSGQIDAAYEELAAGEVGTAIVHLEREVARNPDNPALLINLGAAYAREGRLADARGAYQAAVAVKDRYKLQLADGSWADSRLLARNALVSLDGSGRRQASR